MGYIVLRVIHELVVPADITIKFALRFRSDLIEEFEMKNDVEPTFSTNTLAKALGISVRRVQQLTNQRVLTRLKHGTYDLAAITAFIKFREKKIAKELGVGDYSESRAELLREKVLAARFEREIHEGQYCLVSDATRLVSQLLSEVRTHALGLPTKLAPRLAMLNMAEEIEVLIKFEITKWLTEESTQQAINNLTPRDETLRTNNKAQTDTDNVEEDEDADTTAVRNDN